MAQLSDDCFAFGDRLLSVDEAVRLIGERVPVAAGAEGMRVWEADRRVLATDIVASVDLPRFANSAVDGYAVRFADLAAGGDTILPVALRIAAGDAPGSAPPASAARIFTGAAMPPGLDTVFMQEDVSRDGDLVRLPAGLKAGANRRLAGEDIGRGTVALRGGRRLAPADLALLAALGIAEIEVRRPLRVSLFSTGSELESAGDPGGPGRLFDANRPMLAALLRRLGCTVADGGILPDRKEAVEAALRGRAAESDLILTSGGVSAGEEDHVRAAVEAAGSLTFWRLAVKPGRPAALGIVAGTPFLGLPGNPVAAFVTFCVLARPLVARLAGELYAPPMPFAVTAAFPYRKKAGRREFVRASLAGGGAGGLVASRHPREGAGIITSLTETDGLVDLPETTTRVAMGDTVAFLPYASLV